MYFCQSYGWYFNVFYLPGYMEDRYHVVSPSRVGVHGVNWEDVSPPSIRAGRSGWAPRAACWAESSPTPSSAAPATASWAGESSASPATRCSTVCFLLCPLAPSAFWFFVVISLSAFTSDLTLGSSWASCQDIGRRYTAIVAGTMNMIGSLGAAAAGCVTGFILELSQDAFASRLGIVRQQLTDAQTKAGSLMGYNVSFLIFAAVYFVAVFCWTRLDAAQPVAPDA